MQIDWETKQHPTSSLLMTHRFDDIDDAMLTMVGDDIGLVLKGTNKNDKELRKNETLVGGYTWDNYRVMFVADAEEGEIVVEVLMKTIFDKISEEMLETLKTTDIVDKRNKIFQKLISRSFKTGKERLVRFRSSNRNNIQDNEDMGNISFFLSILDHENYIHWASTGDVNLIGIDNSINYIDLDRADKLTDKLRITKIEYGYIANVWEYLFIGDSTIIERVNLTRYHDALFSTISFHDKLKIIMNAAIQNNVIEDIGFAMTKIRSD